MNKILFAFLTILLSAQINAQRTEKKFNKSWKFFPGDDSIARERVYNDSKWRSLNLPHDWSIEGAFSEKHPAGNAGGSLPGGIGWYRKSFTLPANAKNKRIFIRFDGVYQNSEVWINGHYLGKRPNGYISFQYELTPFINPGGRNVLAVKVDNSAQPNSRWYTGSGIYRNVWLVTTDRIAIDHWGTFVTASVSGNKTGTEGGKSVSGKETGVVQVRTVIRSSLSSPSNVTLISTVYDQNGKQVVRSKPFSFVVDSSGETSVQQLQISNPSLWSTDRPYLYKVVSEIVKDGKTIDRYETPFGIRYFHFDAEKGFYLNGKSLKILGVCNHHDLGALGAAVNVRAMERQLEILKEMGCNAIRTAHNPPAPELLDLCDRMGFLVMDEAFDMWRKRKNRYDYHLDFDKWSRRDLEDMVRRDRNHPSVIIWSIGNEIREQFDSTGISITRELVNIVKALDSTRPVTSALTENFPEKNYIWQSGALDILGFNYKLDAYAELPKRFPRMPLIATETSSALATRGHYDLPSDSMRLWPPDSRSPFRGNEDLTVSAYDHVYAYWGSTHEAGWMAVKKYPFMSGIFVWSGFDFLGEPVPYPWPARSSYYGIIDLAGFPKDVYYMYQSEWAPKPVLHLFPHWNWEQGKLIDVWAYYNQADEAELFLNGRSLGTRKKQDDTLHVMWRVPFEAGTLRAVSRKNGKTVLTREIKTAGKPARIQLIADRKKIMADGEDLSFITVNVLDARGNPVPYADNEIEFTISGKGSIRGVDNGSQTSMESFKANKRKAFNGKCLVIAGSTDKPGSIFLTAKSKGLSSAMISIESKASSSKKMAKK